MINNYIGKFVFIRGYSFCAIRGEILSTNFDKLCKTNPILTLKNKAQLKELKGLIMISKNQILRKQTQFKPKQTQSKPIIQGIIFNLLKPFFKWVELLE